MRKFILMTPFIVSAVVLVGGTTVMADPPALQFTDQEYLDNGIDPSLPDPPNPLNPFNRPPNNFDPTKFVDPLDGVNDGGRATLLANGDIEVNEITGGYRHQGDIIYYTVLAKFTGRKRK